MSRVLATGGPSLVGSRVMLRLPAAGREVRTAAVSLTRAAESRAIRSQDVKPGARVSFVAADRDLQWNGAYGHKWFIDPTNELTVVALTNTAFEGMIGRFTVEVRNAVYGA